MLDSLRSRATHRLSTAIEVVEISALLLGASLSVVFGKFIAAGLFALLAAGVASRFWRKRVVTAPPMPVWGTVSIAVLSLIETGIMVEAINLPVRYGQAGFENSNLLLVAALCVVLYLMQRGLLRRMLAGRMADTSREVARSPNESR